MANAGTTRIVVANVFEREIVGPAAVRSGPARSA